MVSLSVHDSGLSFNKLNCIKSIKFEECNVSLGNHTRYATAVHWGIAGASRRKKITRPFARHAPRDRRTCDQMQILRRDASLFPGPDGVVVKNEG